MGAEIYTLLDELLQENMSKAFAAYEKASAADKDLDKKLEEALLTYGNTAKNRVMKLKEMSENGTVVMYAVLYTMPTGKTEPVVVTESYEKAKEYIKKKTEDDVMKDKASYHIVEVMKYE